MARCPLSKLAVTTAEGFDCFLGTARAHSGIRVDSPGRGRCRCRQAIAEAMSGATHWYRVQSRYAV